MPATKKGYISIFRMLSEKNAHINLVDMVRRLLVPYDRLYFVYHVELSLLVNNLSSLTTNTATFAHLQP